MLVIPMLKASLTRAHAVRHDVAKAMRSIFYRRRIPTEVSLVCRRKKNKNKNLPASCRREILVIFERFRGFFNRKPTDFVKKSPIFLECQRGKKNLNVNFFFSSGTISTRRRLRHP